MWQIFADEYLAPGPVRAGQVRRRPATTGVEQITATVRAFGAEHAMTGTGNGPIAAFCDALSGASTSAWAGVHGAACWTTPSTR